MNLNKICTNKKIYAPLNIKNGNIEVTKYRQRLDVREKN